MSNQSIVDQAEVDARLHGMSSGAVSSESQHVIGEVRFYDLGKEARIVRGRMPTREIEMNTRCVQLYGMSLRNILRGNSTIDIGDARSDRSNEDGRWRLSLHAQIEDVDVTVYAGDTQILHGTFGISRDQHAVKVEEHLVRGRPASAACLQHPRAST